MHTYGDRRGFRRYNIIKSRNRRIALCTRSDNYRSCSFVSSSSYSLRTTRDRSSARTDEKRRTITIIRIILLLRCTCTIRFILLLYPQRTARLSPVAAAAHHSDRLRDTSYPHKYNIIYIYIGIGYLLVLYIVIGGYLLRFLYVFVVRQTFAINAIIRAIRPSHTSQSSDSVAIPATLNPIFKRDIPTLSACSRVRTFHHRIVQCTGYVPDIIYCAYIRLQLYTHNTLMRTVHLTWHAYLILYNMLYCVCVTLKHTSLYTILY